MPRKSIDYSKTIIYKICCNDLTITSVYVGHTTDFIRRCSSHKTNCNNGKLNCKVYQMIRQNGGWLNWTMIEIEKYLCIDSNEATARERYHYEIENSTLNTLYPFRNKKEYYQQNKELLNNNSKEYYKQNKEECNNNSKEYYKQNKEECNNYSKEWKLNNKVKVTNYSKEYYQNNKEKKHQYYEANKHILKQKRINNKQEKLI